MTNQARFILIRLVNSQFAKKQNKKIIINI
jgi:hypothetical protein